MTRVAICQSNYLPWKGYFDLMHDVDVFVFYDDVQYTKNDWRNRNKIKTPQGVQWLTIPVGSHCHCRICDVKLQDSYWQKQHWKTLVQRYGKALHFEVYREFLEDVYLRRQWASLSELNQYLIVTIAHDYLGLTTRFANSSQFHSAGTRQARILRLLQEIGADTYVSGPAAKAYLDTREFDVNGIRVLWKDYSGYPEYPQLYPPFEHAVTILDLLFHTGQSATQYIWGWRGPGVSSGDSLPMSVSHG